MMKERRKQEEREGEVSGEAATKLHLSMLVRTLHGLQPHHPFSFLNQTPSHQSQWNREEKSTLNPPIEVMFIIKMEPNIHLIIFITNLLDKE